MGESDEATPIVIVRGVEKTALRDEEYHGGRFSIPIDDDVFLRSLGYPRGAYA